MAKFEIGEMVMIDKNLEVSGVYTLTQGVMPSMLKHAGETTKIIAINEDSSHVSGVNNWYLLDIDDGDFYWDEDVLFSLKILERNEDIIEISNNNDMVNSPKHYSDKEIEVIDYIEDTLSKDGFIGHMEGNIIKYISRYRHKNGVEDLKKANWYLNRLIEFLEG